MEYEDKNRLGYWHFGSSLFFIFLVGFLIYIFESSGKSIKDISLFDFFLLSFATFRIIRLFTYDSVMDFVRNFFERKKDGGPMETLSQLIHCPWCTGIWAALFVATIYFLTPFSRFFIFVLALAGIGSYLQIIIWKIGKEEVDIRLEKIKKE